MAGEQTLRTSVTLAGGGVTVGSQQAAIPVDTIMAFQKDLPANQANIEIDLAFALDNITAIGIEANADCIVKTNDATSPTDQFSLTANRALVFRRVYDRDSNLFLTQDVTKFFVSTGAGNAQTGLTTWRFVAGIDLTPGIP